MFKKILSHRTILADKVRMEAYQRAIHQVVRKGDVVVDIGAGSGILGFFACQAGAKRVYAIEKDEIIQEAKMLCEMNGLSERVIFLKGRSDEIELPEKVDVVVSELIGYFGLEENLPRFKLDFRKRFLKLGGILIPCYLGLYLVPVEADEIYQENIGFWRDGFCDLNFSSLRKAAVNMRYQVECEEKVNYLCAPARICHINLYEIEKIPLVFQGEFVMQRKGTFHGLVGYFRVGLSRNVILSTSPEDPPTHWRQSFFPMEDPVDVANGDSVQWVVKAIPYGESVFWEWELGLYRKGKKEANFQHSNFHLRKDELCFQKGGFKPTLSQEGEIYREVLNLCCGEKTLEEIAETLIRKYPHKFPSRNNAIDKLIRIVYGKLQITGH